MSRESTGFAVERFRGDSIRMCQLESRGIAARMGEHFMRKWMIASAIVLVVLVAAGFLLRANIHAFIRERMQNVLATHFASTVEFSDFDVRMFPRMHVTITGLVLRHKGRTDIPPLIEVRTVSMYAQLAGLLQPRPYISF